MAEAKQGIQDIGQLVAEADSLVGELRQTMDRVAQSASDEGPKVELQEWSAPIEETPAAGDVSAGDEAQPTDAAETEPDAPTEPEAAAVAEASAIPEATAAPEASAEPGAPAEPESSESGASEAEDSESAESDDPTAQPDPPAEDAPGTREQPSILVSVGESEQAAPAVDAAVAGTEEDAADNPDEAPADSGLVPEVVDATREPESKPDMVIEDEPEETPNVESELLVDATAEAGDTAEARERVRSLDSELAQLADSMIEGGVEDEQTVLVDEGVDPPPRDAESESADEVPAAAPEEAAASEAAQPDPAVVADVSGRGVSYHIRLAAPLRLLARLLPTLWGELSPTARILCERASGPVNKRPPIVRRAVGCVAVVTAMYAVAVLAYVAVLRKPPMIDAENMGMPLVTGSDEADRSPDD